MNKRILFSVLLVFMVLSTVILFSSIGYRSNSPVTPTPPDVIATPPEEVIKDVNIEFSKKYSRPLDVFKLSLDTDLGDYAKGSVTLKGEGGGGIWFASRVNGVWELIYDGDGIIPCSDLKQYPEFPSSLIPQCFDDNINMLIKR